MSSTKHERKHNARIVKIYGRPKQWKDGLTGMQSGDNICPSRFKSLEITLNDANYHKWHIIRQVSF